MSTTDRRRMHAESWTQRGFQDGPVAIEAGAKLREHLLEKYFSGLLPASELAIQAHYHTLAGCPGLDDLAVKPEFASKRANHHILAVVGKAHGVPDLTRVDVPSHEKTKAHRDTMAVYVRLPSSFMGAQREEQSPCVEPREDPWSPLYTDAISEGVRARGGQWTDVQLYSLYWDGVRYTTRDQFIAFYYNDLRAQKTYLCWLVRKLDLCKCGCRGWCTMFPLLQMWCDDLASLAVGEPPAFGVYTKADWPAFCEVGGFRQWGHDTFPCFACDVDACQITDRTSIEGISLDGGSWDDYSDQAYRRDISRSKIVITILDDNMRDAIKSALRYRKSLLGRGLISDLRMFEPPLWKGDRLEPTKVLLDVGEFEYTQTPFQATFWRMREDDRVLHESPIFGIPGLSTERHGICTLHTWHLGPVIRVVPVCLWFLLSTPLFNSFLPFLSNEDNIKIGMLQIKGKLLSWYKSKRETDRHWHTKGSEVWNLTSSMMGTAAKPCLTVKAAEARGLLEFIVDLMGEMVPKLSDVGPHRPKGELLLACVQAALRFDMQLRTHSITNTVAERQLMLDTYSRHVYLFVLADGTLTPKHHLLFHMIIRSGYLGSPCLHSTYRDESWIGHVLY